MESPPILNPSSIINLNLSSKDLASIDHIKQYKNLIELDISDNNFKDPDTALTALTTFIYLRKVNLGYNKLRVVPTLPKNIEILILNNNSIATLNDRILQIPRLTTIDLSNNFITDISLLQKVQSLKYIFLKNNKIKSFGCLSSLEKLQELDLEGNNVDNPEDLNLFSNHQLIKIISVRNTPLCNEPSIKRNPQTHLPSLPLYKEGAFCRSARALKTSFTYTSITSNPNRSVLINRSLINSKKHISEEDLSDEFSFDQIPHEAMNGSLLGSMRSNILDIADPAIYDSSTIRDRSNNLSLDMMNKGILNTGSRIPTADRDITKGGSSRSQEPQQNNKGTGKKAQQIPLMKRKNRFDMRLDLSTILKVNSFDRVALGFEGLSYADLQKVDTKKQEHGHHIKMEFPAPQFSSTNRSQALENKFSIPPHTDNERLHSESIKFSANQTLNSFVNQLESARPMSSYRITFQNESFSLGEAYEGLKKENQELRKAKEELLQKVSIAEKENDNLIKSFDMAQDEIKSLKRQIEKLETENSQFKISSKGLEDEMENRTQKLQKVLESFSDKENEEDKQDKHIEVLDYDCLLKMVQEKLTELEDLMQIDMNTRILEKFDQLRNYYRKKQERLTMTINDLESRINLQINEKILYLERSNSVLQANYQELLKKYNKVKHNGTENKRHNATNQSNRSINNSKQPLRALNLSVEDIETSPEIREKSKLGKIETLFGPKIHFRKEPKAEDHISNLKNENCQLKMSLEGVTKKIETLTKENDELKTVSYRNTYSLKMRVKELEKDNAKLLAMVNQKKFRTSLNNHHMSFDKNCDTSLKTHNISCEDEPSCSVIENFKYPVGKQEREGFAFGDIKLKNHLLKLKKKYENVDKELKVTKERNTNLVKKMNSFVDYANKSNDMLNEYPQLKNLCFQFQDAVQNT